MKGLKKLLPAIAVYAQNTNTENLINLQPTDPNWGNLANLTIPGIISGLIRLTLTIAALLFFAVLVWGGIRWITSKGDKQEVENARNQITHALIGLAIVFVAWAIAKLIKTLFGIDILQLNIPSLQ